MNEQISTIQTREALELMRGLAPILNQKELFEFMLFSNRVLERYMPEHYNDRLSEEVMEMKKDKEWLKNEVKSLFDEAYDSGKMEYYESEESIHRINSLVDQLDEPEQTDTNVGLSKPVIPQFVADWIDAYNLYGNNPLREYIDLESDFNEGWTDEKDAAVYHWINKNPYAFIDALRYGYEVEKEPQWVVRYEDGYFSEEIKFGCGIDGDWVDEVSRAYHFTDKAKAEAVALLIGGTVEEVTQCN